MYLVMVNLKPFFTYFGGKYRIALRYPRSRWVTLVEPFAGSAGYSVRHYNRRVLLYDINVKVFGTWDYLIKASASEIQRLPLVFDDVRELKICQEAKWVIGWWLNKGCAGPRNIPGARMRGGTRPNSYWGEAIRERLAYQVGFIRHWRVFNLSYQDSVEGREATYFVDPPYQRSGKYYPHHTIDYAHLARFTRNLFGQVIACGQLGDNWLPFTPFVNTRGTHSYGKARISKEMIWTK